MTAPFTITPWTARHGRQAFRCGVDSLDQYLKERAGQDARRRAAACFVAVHGATGRLAGYYTLAVSGVPMHDVDPGVAETLPRAPSIPVARLARLAVDVAYQGHRLGAALLWDAVIRAMEFEIGAFALVAESASNEGDGFLIHQGLLPIGSAPGHYVLPLTTILATLRAAPAQPPEEAAAEASFLL